MSSGASNDVGEESEVLSNEIVSVDFLTGDPATEWWLYEAAVASHSPSDDARPPQQRGRDDGVNGVRPPCCFLALSYPGTDEVWIVEEKSGEAYPMLARVHSMVTRQMILLPTHVTGPDQFVSERPVLAAIQEPRKSDQPNTNYVSCYSLHTSEVVREIPFKAQILSICANSRVVVVSTRLEIVLLSASTLQVTQTIMECHAPLGTNAVALGGQWLAFTDHQRVDDFLSLTESCRDHQMTYTAQAMAIAKATMVAGYSAVSEAFYGWTGAQAKPEPSPLPRRDDSPFAATDPGTGIVTVVDLDALRPQNLGAIRGSKNVYTITGQGGAATEYVVAHFTAFSQESIAELQFNDAGNLIVACVKSGRMFNLYHIENRGRSWQTVIHHVRTLNRGNTTAVLGSVDFSLDSHFLGVATEHGTVHVYDIASVAATANTYESSSPATGASRYGPSLDTDSALHSESRNRRESFNRLVLVDARDAEMSLLEGVAVGHPQHGGALSSRQGTTMRWEEIDPALRLKPVQDVPASAVPGSVSTDTACPVQQTACKVSNTTAAATAWMNMGCAAIIATFRQWRPAAQFGRGPAAFPCCIVFSAALQNLVLYAMDYVKEEGSPGPCSVLTAKALGIWRICRSGSVAVKLDMPGPAVPTAVTSSGLLISVLGNDEPLPVRAQAHATAAADRDAQSERDGQCMDQFCPLTAPPARMLLDTVQFNMLPTAAAPDRGWQNEEGGTAEEGALQFTRAVRGPLHGAMSGVELENRLPSEEAMVDSLADAAGGPVAAPLNLMD